MTDSRLPTVFVVSDGHGDTAHQVVTAAALQFDDPKYRLVVERNVLTAEEVVRVVEKAAELKGVIFYTLVAEETRVAMREAAARHVLQCVDIMGPAFDALHDVLRRERGSKPGLLYAVIRERSERMEAIDYTLRHDDGQRPEELEKADVVLVGVSRASKSSTCFYLAYAGVSAANVPLIPEVAPPDHLLRLPKEKVIGLRVNVQRLMSIRETRARDLCLDETHSYLDKRSVAREVAAANHIMDEHGWRSIDTSYMAIEEVAKRVMRLRGLKGQRP